jgi:hypothetical protein
MREKIEEILNDKKFWWRDEATQRDYINIQAVTDAILLALAGEGK